MYNDVYNVQLMNDDDLILILVIPTWSCIFIFFNLLCNHNPYHGVIIINNIADLSRYFDIQIFPILYGVIHEHK